MTHVRKSTLELIAEEEKKVEQVKSRMAELKARQRVEDRRRDSHRKIVAGATLMAHVKIDPQFRKTVQDAFNKALTNPKNRAAILDLIDERAFQEAMRAAARKADAEAKEVQEVSLGAEKQPAPPTRPQQQAESARSHAPVPRRNI
jgi:hypothetical protein